MSSLFVDRPSGELTPAPAVCLGTVVSDSESPTYEKVCIKLRAGFDVTTNTMVRIPLPRAKAMLIGRVRSGLEHNPHESAESINVRDALQLEARYPAEADSTIIYRSIVVDLLAEVSGGEIHAPETLPSAGSEAFLADATDVRDVLGLAADAANGLCLGDTIGAKSFPVILKREAIQRHVFIGGTTGSGKSYAMTVLAEELMRHSVPIVFIDTQNEYCDFVSKAGGHVVTPGTDFNVRISSLTPSELLALIPGVQEAEVQRNIISIAFNELRDELTDEKINKFVLSDLLDRIDVVGPKFTKNRDSIALARMRTGLLAREDVFGEGVSRADWPKKMVPCLSIACKQLKARRLQPVATAVLRELEDLRTRKFIPPYVAVVDEAHLFVPEGQDTPCKQIIRETVRIGRHHGIAMVLLTQSPVDIDRSAIRQCNTRLVFALEPDQLDAIRGVRADATEEMLRALPKMPRGTCLISGTYESVRHAVVAKIRERTTKDVKGGQDYPMFESVLAEKWRR